MTKKLECSHDNPLGYSIFMYLKNGGCLGTWQPTLKKAIAEVLTFKPHDGIIIVKLRYKDRANRHVIQRALNLNDSGIYTKRGTG